MAHELKATEDVGGGIRRLAEERLARSLERLREHDGEVVHDVRKDCKQVRALLRLVRDELGEAVYRRENDRLRDLARPLSELRDAQALVSAFDALLEHFRRELRPGAFSRLRRALREELRAHERTGSAARRRTAIELRRALREARAWPIEHRGWKAIGPGLERTYARGRAAMREAHESSTDEALHEWRKQAKYLRAELDVLARAAPGSIEGTSGALHQLSDLLGDDHDLAVLGRSLDERLAGAVDDEERAALLGLLFRRRHALQREAFMLGAKLFAEPPRLFADALRAHWRSWREAERADERC